MGALGNQLPDVGGLIDVVAVILADFAKGLNADGQFALGRLFRLGGSFCSMGLL